MPQVSGREIKSLSLHYGVTYLNIVKLMMIIIQIEIQKGRCTANTDSMV